MGLWGFNLRFSSCVLVLAFEEKLLIDSMAFSSLMWIFMETAKSVAQTRSLRILSLNDFRSWETPKSYFVNVGKPKRRTLPTLADPKIPQTQKSSFANETATLLGGMWCPVFHRYAKLHKQLIVRFPDEWFDDFWETFGLSFY